MRRLLTWFALITWMLGIFLLSHQPGLGTGLGAWDLVLRKLAHMAEFGILTVLLSMTLRQEGVPVDRGHRLAAVTALVYAVSDELHQHFVPQRHGTPVDVAIDAIGIGAAYALLRRRHATRDR